MGAETREFSACAYGKPALCAQVVDRYKELCEGKYKGASRMSCHAVC